MDVSLDGSTDGFAGKIEILEDRYGRRFRSEGERARIAAESLVPGVRVADVARRHEVGTENWALLASLIANCKMGDVDPVRYLTNTLQALLDGHPKRSIDELMPWNFEVASTQAA